MKDRSVLSGHIACFMAYAIFGVNIIVCKDLTGGHLISPIAIFTLRSLGNQLNVTYLHDVHRSFCA